MRDVLRTPARFMDHFRQYSANVVLKSMLYRFTSYRARNTGADPQDNPFVVLLERMLASANPGTHLVDLLPSLDRLPDVLAPWRAAALDQRALNHRVFLGLLRSVREKVARGELAADNAFATRLWEGRERFAMDELDVAYLAGTMFEAGTDTTAAAISTFVLAAISYPEVFKTAQAEVVSVCGDNPPTMAEFEQCEYVRAMCKETLRWRTVTAGGLPHMATTTEDDWYHGMCIPAGAILIPNHWGMCFNPRTYGQKYDPQLFE
ncbi:cytochrome P450, partial [Gautieria morchelliformis]